MKRIAIVVQRYGEEINGGAELHARQVAERLTALFDVVVLTSCARDYSDWAPVYAPGPCRVNGVAVVRFEHPRRNDIGRARVDWVHKLRFKLRHLLRLRPRPLVPRRRGEPGYDGLDYLRRQGPHCPGLLQHLAAAAADYDAVVFFTALYEPSAVGILTWGPRSVLVPLLHDEKAMYQPVYGDVLRAAGALLFNTDAERRLATRLYGVDTRAAGLGGVGIEIDAPAPAQTAKVLQQHRLTPGYFVYVGRIDVAKGCRELVEAFRIHARRHPGAQLALVGQRVMDLPDDAAIVCTGFVSEADRDSLIAGAAALVIPSRYESLSMVLLEAMLLRTPVIANGDCEVLADHLRVSATGIAYRGRRGLLRALREISTTSADRRQQLGALGEAYVRSHFAWPRVIAAFARAIDDVSSPSAGAGGS